MNLIINYNTCTMKLTKEEYAQILGVSRPTVYYRQEQGQLPDALTVDDVWKEVERLEQEARTIRKRLSVYIAGENGNETISN